MTTITINDNTVPIHVDAHGNLYLEFKNKLLQLNVDRDNSPYLEIGDYNIIDTPDETRNIVYSGKIVKSEKFVNDKYFPEDNGHTLVNDSHTYNSENEDDEQQFMFYQNDKIKICEREFGDINALYDIFIYDDNDSLDTQLIFQSKLPNEICLYRVILYTSGKFFFRAIGCFIENKYKLEIKNNTIECIRA